jgi:hypothetical protein
MRDQMRDQVPNPADLDRLLDSALATYADPGRDSGLEGRVLAALATARTESSGPIAPRRWRWLPWMIAIPVAASLILLWIFASTRVVHAPTQPQQSRDAQPAPDSSLRASAPAAAAHRVEVRPNSVPRVRHAAPTAPRVSQEQTSRATALPKLDVFPTPQPLSPQEQVMLAFAQQAPEAQVEALSAAQAKDEESFAFAASHISPFEPPAEGKN